MTSASKLLSDLRRRQYHCDANATVQAIRTVSESSFNAHRTCLLTFGSISNGGLISASDIDLICVSSESHMEDRLSNLKQLALQLGRSCHVHAFKINDNLTASPPLLFALATCQYAWGNRKFAIRLFREFDLLLSQLSSTRLLLYWDGDPYRHPGRHKSSNLKMAEGGLLDCCFRRLLVRWAHVNNVNLGTFAHFLIVCSSLLCRCLRALRAQAAPSLLRNGLEDRSSSLPAKLCIKTLLRLHSHVVRRLFWHFRRKEDSYPCPIL